MSVPSVPPGGGSAQTTYWGQGEIPPGPPMSLSSAWVKYMEKLWPNVDPGVLSAYAYKFQSNMMQMIGSQIQKDQQKAHEAAQQMKQAILGND